MLSIIDQATKTEAYNWVACFLLAWTIHMYWSIRLAMTDLLEYVDCDKWLQI